MPIENAARSADAAVAWYQATSVRPSNHSLASSVLP